MARKCAGQIVCRVWTPISRRVLEWLVEHEKGNARVAHRRFAWSVSTVAPKRKNERKCNCAEAENSFRHSSPLRHRKSEASQAWPILNLFVQAARLILIADSGAV